MDDPVARLPCPFCSHPESAVVETRGTHKQVCIRRRRRCKLCSARFTTFEITDKLYSDLIVKGEKMDRLVNQLKDAVE